MLRFKFLAVAAVILLVTGAWTAVYAQIETVGDTLRVVDAYGDPGDTIPVMLYLANTIEVGGLNFLLRFDSTHMAPAYDWATINTWGDETAPLHYDLINRGAGKFLYTNSINSIDTSSTFGHIVTGVFIGDPDLADDIAVGAGTFARFYIYIKPTAIAGDSIAITPFDEQFSGGRMNEYFDPNGEDSRFPFKIRGWVHVSGTPPEPDHNEPPFFTQPSSTVFTVEQGNQVQFVVGASDPNTGQRLELSMVSGPSGSTFSDAIGFGSVSSSFSWTPNISQAGSFNASFRVEDDSAAVANFSVVINVTAPEIEEDLLYTTSQEAHHLVRGGIPGVNDVSVPVNLSDLNVLYGIQFDLTYDYSVMSMDSITPTDRLSGFETYTEVIGPGVTRLLTFHLDGDRIAASVTSNAIFYCWFTMKSTASPGYYRFKLSNGVAAVSPDPEQGSVAILVDTLGTIAVDALGDVNLDRKVDVADLVSVVAYIIGNSSLSTRNHRAGDINADSYVNVVDLVGIINMIFTNVSPSPVPKAMFAGGSAELDIVMMAENSRGDRTLALRGDLPTEVAGMQFDLKFDPELVELGQPELTELTTGLDLLVKDQGNGRLRVLMYVDPNDLKNVVDAGIGDLVTVPVYSLNGADIKDDAVTIEGSVLSDPSAQEIPVSRKTGQLPQTFSLEQNYPNPFNPETHISFSIDGQQAQSVRLDVYNILGQKVTTLLDDNLAPGSYQVTWDGTSSSGEKQASGVYFYNIVVGEGRETKKMVLAK
ncbi:MAG: cohesin domain-containing protein [Candidatus Zixiibacteriota bacterium]